MKKFVSTYRKYWNHSKIEFPEQTGIRIMMMPIILGSSVGIPDKYKKLINDLYGMVENRLLGQVGYLTIDEQFVKKGECLRRPGLHVDGYYHGKCGAWGGGGSWGSVGNGMILVSNTGHCKAYLGVIDGEPGPEGKCDHLELPDKFEVMDPGFAYWVDGACVHESLPVEEDTKRTLIRMSMPSNGPWFEGYTKNPCGVLPSGEILPRRKFMRS